MKTIKKLKEPWLKCCSVAIEIVEIDPEAKISAGYEDEHGKWIENEDYDKQIKRAHGKRMFIGEITHNGRAMRAQSGMYKPKHRNIGLNRLLKLLCAGLESELFANNQEKR